MNKIEQLIQKNCNDNSYGNIFPITTLQAIIDQDNGKNLDEILQTFNHIYLSFIGNSKKETRLQILPKYRRKGLFITYTSCKNGVITEYYNANDLSNDSWGDSNNWVKILGEEILKELIEKDLFWYKV